MSGLKVDGIERALRDGHTKDFTASIELFDVR